MPYGGFSPVRLQGRFIRQDLRLQHREQCRVVCVHPSYPPLPSSGSSSCVEGRCAFEHHPSSGLHRFTPGALAPTRLCSPGLHRLSHPIRPTRHLASSRRSPFSAVTLLGAGYNYDGHWLALSMGLSPIRLTSSLAARPRNLVKIIAPGRFALSPHEIK